MARRPIARSSVQTVRIEGARELFTTTPNAHEEDLESAEGAIVRLRVQHGDADVEVSRAHKSLASVAEKVVIQRPSRSKVPSPETPQTKAVTARDAVLALAEESSFHDKPRLMQFLENVMSACGI